MSLLINSSINDYLSYYYFDFSHVSTYLYIITLYFKAQNMRPENGKKEINNNYKHGVNDYCLIQKC